jgi:hypothetical protein
MVLTTTSGLLRGFAALLESGSPTVLQAKPENERLLEGVSLSH